MTRNERSQKGARYDADALAACLDHLRADDCVHSVRVLRLMTFPAECAPVRVAIVGVGAPCKTSLGCESLNCVMGVCAAPATCDGR